MSDMGCDSFERRERMEQRGKDDKITEQRAEIERLKIDHKEINVEFNRLNGVITQQMGEIEQKQTLIASLILAAQIHAQEARTANATIYEIYQCVSGSTGEPGNWHGAQPVRDAFEKLQAQLATAKGEVWNCVTHELTKRRNACLEAMARPYAENEWRGKAELFMHLIHWSQKQKEVQS